MIENLTYEELVQLEERIQKEKNTRVIQKRKSETVDDITKIFVGCLLDQRLYEQLSKDVVEWKVKGDWRIKEHLYPEDFREGSIYKEALEKLQKQVGYAVYISGGSFTEARVECDGCRPKE